MPWPRFDRAFARFARLTRGADWIARLALAWMVMLSGCAVTSRDRPEVSSVVEQDAGLRLRPSDEANPAISAWNAEPTPMPPAQTDVQSPRLEELPSAAAIPLGPPAPLTLEQAIAECLCNHPSLRAAQESVQQARADVATVGLLPNPDVTVISSLNPYPGHPFNPVVQGGPPQMDYWLDYDIDTLLFGKRDRAIDEARLGVGVANAELRELARERVSATIDAFYDLLQIEAQSRADIQQVEFLRHLAEYTARRVQALHDPPYEVSRIQSALRVAERTMQLRRAERDVAASRLRALLGRCQPELELSIVGTLAVNPKDNLPPIDEVTRIAEQHRPDLLALRRRIRQAEADVDLQRALGWPTVQGSLLTSYQNQSVIGFPDAPSYGGGVQVEVPIFERNQGNVSRAASVLRQSHCLLAAGCLEARTEVEQAITRFRAARIVAADTDPAGLDAALRVREAMADAYFQQTSDVDLDGLLGAHEAFRDAVEVSIDGQADYWRAWHQVNIVAGTRVLD
jgi:cobalt-zinc-cadmium efflux system outer membrane protein